MANTTKVPVFFATKSFLVSIPRRWINTQKPLAKHWGFVAENPQGTSSLRKQLIKLLP